MKTVKLSERLQLLLDGKSRQFAALPPPTSGLSMYFVQSLDFPSYLLTLRAMFQDDGQYHAECDRRIAKNHSGFLTVFEYSQEYGTIGPKEIYVPGPNTFIAEISDELFATAEEFKWRVQDWREASNRLGPARDSYFELVTAIGKEMANRKKEE